MTRPYNPDPAPLPLPGLPLKENLHTHTTFCDGKNTPEEMVLSALKAGFHVLGFSGHSYTSFDESYCMSRQDTIKYIAQVRDLAQKYRDRITVLCGIERDYYAYASDNPDNPDDPDGGPYDYVIGSVHAFFKPWEPDASDVPAVPGAASTVPSSGALAAPGTATSSGVPAMSGTSSRVLSSGSPESNLPPGILAGRRDGKNGYYVYVDYERQALEWAIKNLYNGDALSLAEDYFEAVSHIHERTGCQIIGHFDLLTKFEQQDGAAPLFDCGHPRYQAAVDKALAALLPTGAVFEINTGAMAKGYRTEPYPSARILKKIHAGGGNITITSDCHAAGKLDFAFDEAARLARDCGFTSAQILLPGGPWLAQSL